MAVPAMVERKAANAAPEGLSMGADTGIDQLCINTIRTLAMDAVQQANKVDKGIIIGARQIDVTASGVVGAATGAAAGGAVGANTPGGGLAATFGAIGGGLLGGIVGTAAEHTTADTTAYEYIVRKLNGELVSVTQKDAIPLAVGEHVLVIAGNQARIVPDYTVSPDPPAAGTTASATAAARTSDSEAVTAILAPSLETHAPVAAVRD